MPKALTASWQTSAARRRAHAVRDSNGGLAAISPIDLGIKAAREVFARSGRRPQMSHRHHRQHGAGELRRLSDAAPHRALFRLPIETPRTWCSVCGTGIEVLMQAPTRSRIVASISRSASAPSR